MEAENQAPVIYSPAAVLNLFNNSISLKQTQRIIQLKGIFQLGKGAFYNGSYYDSLRDESSDAQITLIVPALIRNEMQHNKTITINGFITRRVVNNASRIDIQLTVTDLVDQTLNKYSSEEIKRIEIQQEKAAAGFRDVQSWIKEKIIQEHPFKIGVVVGKNAIIDNDIKHQLRESIAFYQLDFHRINLSSETEIIKTLNQLDEQGTDIIVISRGGGENLEIFNKPAIAEKATGLNALLITAIGHKDDVTLLQKVADKAFITPSEFGQFLNDTYNQTIEEVQNSRAQLVESVKKQLTANYEKEINNLKQQIKAVEELKKKNNEDLEKVYSEKINGLNSQISLLTNTYNQQLGESQKLQNEKQAIFNDQVNNYKAQLSKLENKSSVNWTAVIIAVILGIIIGMLIKSH
ncbi:exodeoxyribonuclease VII large subunit [Mucilaginibacter sp. PAMB04168]|uniref:exodeoxyribonuclease VII large subunit n=1 Tax=Mucilaginibacter sp. PAMB04168 TaxID=3138567 RepID=UPI0031F63E4F